MLKLVAVFCGHFDLMAISVVLPRFHRKRVLSLFCISMSFVYVTHKLQEITIVYLIVTVNDKMF